MRSLGSIISDARARMEMESTKGSDWTFFNMTEQERDAFDKWIVEINHVLAHEPGTTERRFRLFMNDFFGGRYKGALP